MLSNSTIGASVVLVGTKGSFRHDDRGSELFVTMKEAKLGKIAGRPAAQFPESLELALIMSLAPSCRVSGFCRRFHLNKGTWWRALPDECDVGPAHARVSILGKHREPRRNGQQRKQILEKLLERRG